MSVFLIVTLSTIYMLVGATFTRLIKSMGSSKDGTTSFEDFVLVVFMLLWPLVLTYGFLAVLAGGTSSKK